MSRPAIGARTTVKYAEESTWGVPETPPDRAIEVTSESLSQAIGDLRSTALRGDRAVHKRVRGTSAADGDLAWEQNVIGFETVYKHALGRNMTLSKVDGGIRAQISADIASDSTTITCYSIPDTFPSSGYVSIVYQDADGDLAKVEEVEYDSKTSTVFTLALDLGTAIPKGSYLFLYDDTYAGVYTHYIEPAIELPAGLTLEIVRDIALFLYSGAKVNVLTETYAASAMLTGTFGMMAKDEWSGDWLSANCTTGDTFISLVDNSRFPTAGTIAIGSEFDIAYTGKDANNHLTGVTGIATAHLSGEPVSLSVSMDTAVVPDTHDPLTSFYATVYMDGVYQEVLSINWTLTNNLKADKIPMGSRFRAMLPEQNRTVEGTMHVEFDDMNLYSKYTKGTAAKIEIRGIESDQEIGSTGVCYQKHVIFPVTEFTGSTPQAGGPELIEHDMPFVALWDDVNDKPEVIVIFVNDQATI